MPGRLLCEAVHAAGPNDRASLQSKFTRLPNDLLALGLSPLERRRF